MTEVLKFCHVKGKSVHMLFVLDGRPGWCLICDKFVKPGEIVHVVKEVRRGYIE